MAAVAPGAAFGAVPIALYALANAGAHLAFIPLLQILVPLQAIAIDPGHARVLLSQVALCGALAATAANIVFGTLSDRTRRRTGARRPWLVGGLAATVLSYAAIWHAASPLALLAGVVAFQCAFNALFAPLSAVLADDVPEARKGLVSALLSLGSPLANIVGAAALGALAASRLAQFAVLGLLVPGYILPFLWRMERPPPPPQMLAAPKPVSARVEFARAVAGRLLVVIALSIVETYLLLYLRHFGVLTGMTPGRLAPAYAELIGMITVANVVCSLAAGYLSDLWGGRSWFVVVGAGTMACGIAGMALAGSWNGLLLSVLVYGCGAGIHYAVDLALIVQLLPRRADAGRELGIVNLANTVPQVIAPLLALMILRDDSGSFRTLLLVAALACLLGGACVLGVGRQNSRQALLF